MDNRARKPGRFLAPGLVALALLAPTPALAQGMDAEMAAGRAALSAGELDSADRHFLAAHAMGGGTGALFNLGLVASKRGNCTALTFYFSRVLVDNPSDPDRPLLEREVGKCVKKVGTFGTLHVDTQPAGAEVAVRFGGPFGHPTGAHDLWVAAPIDVKLPEGRYAVVVRKKGYLAQESWAEVSAGKEGRNRVVLTRAPSEMLPVMEPVAPPLVVKEPEVTPDAPDLPPIVAEPTVVSGPLTPWGWTAVGLGAATFGAAIALNVIGDGKMQKANDEQVPGTGPYVDLYNEGRSLHNAGVGLYVTGGALLAGGIVLLVIDEPETAQAVSAVVPWVEPNSVGLSATARF